MSPSPWRRETVLLAVASLVLMASFITFVLDALPALTFGHGLNYVEGLLLDQSRRVHEAPGLYPPFETAPYVMDNYGPVYPTLVSLIPGPAHAPFFAGRFVSVVSTLVAAWMVFLLLKPHSGDAVGLFCAGVFLCIPEIRKFAVLMRVDALALALGLAGLTMIQKKERGWRIAACVAFFLCVYTRHSMITMPLLGMALLVTREGRRALVWPAGLLGAGVVTFILGDLITDGRMHLHLISFNLLNYEGSETVKKWFKTQWPWAMPIVMAAFVALRPVGKTYADRLVPWRPKVYGFIAFIALCCSFAFVQNLMSQPIRGVPEAQVTNWMRFQWGVHNEGFSMGSLIAVHGALAAVGLLAMVKWFFTRGRCEHDGSWDSEGIFGLMVVVGLASATLIGRVGSDVNYLSEYLTLLLLVSGWGLGRGGRVGRVLILVCLLGYLAFGVHARSYRDTRSELLAERAQVSEKILDALRDIEGPILTEGSLGPSYPTILGRPLEYQAFMYRQITDAGVWDPSPLLEDIRNQKFAAVVRIALYPDAVGDDGQLYNPKQAVWPKTSSFPPVVAEAIRAAYDPDPSTLAVEKVTPRLFRGTALWKPSKKD